MGWYQGNARLDDTVLPERAMKVAETIKKNNNEKAILFLVRYLDEHDRMIKADIKYIVEQ